MLSKRKDISYHIPQLNTIKFQSSYKAAYKKAHSINRTIGFDPNINFVLINVRLIELFRKYNMAARQKTVCFQNI